MTCPRCEPAEAEAQAVAELCAWISAAITGKLRAGDSYPGKPIVSVEEALVLYRALERCAERKLLAQYRGLADVEAKDIAEERDACLRLALEEVESVLKGTNGRETT